MKNTFSKRLTSMLKVDFRRMFTMPLFYIMLGISFVMPILILIMTTMMDGTVSVDPQTGKETIIEGFDNVWQIIGSLSSEAGLGMSMETGASSMGLTTMCNINLIYFGLSALICIFVSEDFRSGYSKCLFVVRPNKVDYVISKTILTTLCGMVFIITFFIGSMLGGKIAGLPFETTATSTELIMCILSKVALVGVFSSLFLTMSVIGKQKLWLSIIISLGASMLLFAMIPLITPLDASITNVILCLIGSVLFSIGLGTISNLILKKSSLV